MTEKKKERMDKEHWEGGGEIRLVPETGTDFLGRL